MSDTLLLGVDVGTTNCKALVLDPGGAVRGSGSVPTPTARPRPGEAEYDPEALWLAVVAAVRQALGAVDARRVRGVAVASMAESGALLDARGEPLGPIIAWHDTRTVPLYRRWLEQVGRDTFFATVGNLPKPIFGLFKLLWLREHMPAAYAAAARWLHVGDYIAYRLCGAQATDYSLATRTMLLDLGRLRWAEPVLERAGLRADLLPELAPSGSRIGGVSRAAAEATGLAPGVAVGAGGHDHICGALGVGVRRQGACLDSMGTSEAAFLALDSLQLDRRLSEQGCSFGVHAARGRYYVMDGIRSSGSAASWAERLLALPQGAAEGGAALGGLERAAAAAPPGSRGVFFTPNVESDSLSAFVGLTPHSDVGALSRAVYEGLAYEWRSYLERMEGMTGARADTIKLIGGGSRVALWRQIKADVLNRPLRVVGADEGAALGAAVLGGLAAGVYADEDEAFAALSLDERTIEPDPARAAFYEQCYTGVYRRIAPALAEVNRAIEQLQHPPAA